MGSDNGKGDRDGWARLRFAVVGPLLASPPPKGRLRAELERLAQQSWEHPTGGGQVRFSASTIERWYYQARSAHQDPVKGPAPAGADRCRPRAEDVGDADRGFARSVQGPSVLVRCSCTTRICRRASTPSRLSGRCRSYATLTRVMRSLGLERQRRAPPVREGARAAGGRGTRGAELRGVAQPRPVARLMWRSPLCCGEPALSQQTGEPGQPPQHNPQRFFHDDDRVFRSKEARSCSRNSSSNRARSKNIDRRRFM